MKINEKEALKNFLTEIENQEYVIPRGHTKIPCKITGDLDLISKEPEKTVKVAKNFGFKFEKKSVSENFLYLSKKSLKNPRAAVSTLSNNPKKALNLVLNKSGDPQRKYKDYRLWKGELMIHIQDRVLFKSTMDNSKIPADPRITESLIQNRYKQKRAGVKIFIPSKPDELLHLVGRGVFDYGGQFPNYYSKRCYELWEDFSEKQKGEFKELSELLFFNANNMVIKKIQNEDLNNLKNDLYSYSNY